MLASGWFALTVSSTVFAQEAEDQNKPVAEAEQTKATAQADDTDAADTGARKRKSRRTTDIEELAAQVGTIKPAPPEAEQVCRKISVTGTRFTKRECRTADQWAEVDASRSASGRRFTREIQSQTSVIVAPSPEQSTPESRPSGLPSPAGF
jgi:hypothetical protein